LILTAIAALTQGLDYVPALFGDDWNQGVEQVLLGNARWIDFGRLRPLLFAPFLALHAAFGMAFDWWYLAVFGLYPATALVLYAILLRLPCRVSKSQALFAAALFLVYPTNFTHMWLTAAHYYLALLLALGHALCLLLFVRGCQFAYLAVSFLLLLPSLGLYEAQLGIVALWPCILFVAFRGERGLALRLWTFAPGLLGVGLSLAHVLTFRSPDIYYNVTRTNLDLADLASRLALGYKVSLLWGWTRCVRELFLPDAVTAAIATGLCGSVLAALYAGRAVTGPQGRSRAIGESVSRGAVGFVMVAAGYLPVITMYLPNLSGFGSRFNLWASIGSAVLATSVIVALARLLGVQAEKEDRLVWAAGAPLLLLGALCQISVQERAKQAWSEQQEIWKGTFEVAPSFQGGTMVLFVLPGYEEEHSYETWGRTPFAAGWDAASGLRMMYGDSTLDADVFFPNVESEPGPDLIAQGVRNWRTGKVVPYENVTAFRYERHGGELVRMEILPARYVQAATGDVRLCKDCIRESAPREAGLAMRRLAAPSAAGEE